MMATPFSMTTRSICRPAGHRTSELVRKIAFFRGSEPERVSENDHEGWRAQSPGAVGKRDLPIASSSA